MPPLLLLGIGKTRKAMLIRTYFSLYIGLMYKSLQLHAWNHKFPPRNIWVITCFWGPVGFLGGQWIFWFTGPPGSVVATVQCQGLSRTLLIDFLSQVAGMKTSATSEVRLCRVLHMMFRHFRANTFACYDTLTKSSGEQGSSSSRQHMRWAIVCGSPQSQLTDCVLSMMPHLLTVVFQRPFPVRRCRRSHGRLDLAGRCSNRSWYLSWIRDRIPQDKIPQHKKWTKSHNVKIGK